MNSRGGRVHAVFRHSPIDPVLEPKDIAKLAHPVIAVEAESTGITRHDLLGNNAVTDRDAMLFGSVLAERDNVAGVLVSGYARTLDGAADAVLSPEQLSAREALHIRSADAAGIDLNQQFTHAWFRNRHLFDSVVTGPVYPDSRHRLSDHSGLPPHSRFAIAHRVNQLGQCTLAARAQFNARIRAVGL